MRILGLLLALQIGVGPLPTGAVSGRIRTVEGAPAPHVRVALTTLQDPSVLMHITETDEAGVYRISQVPPGSYLIVAGRATTPTFYPSAVNLTDAIPVPVTEGVVLRDVDVTLKNQPEPQPLNGALLNALVSSGAVPPPPGSGWITGQVLVDGPHQWPDMRLLVTMAYSWARGGGGRSTTVNPDGTFRFQVGAAAGCRCVVDVHIGITGRDRPELPDDYYVKFISDGTTDLLHAILKLDQAVPDITIQLGVGQRVMGTIRRDNGQAAGFVTVDLLPRSEADLKRLKRTVESDASGNFVMRGVAPGEYTLIVNGRSSMALSVSENLPALNLVLTQDQILK
jgi:hypothetical protein